ncbi:MAG TPA: calcium-translocating P-type ATPase, PMCA-type, partial [Candidatus Aenigmarchaeota archaeon]|nr:calcium-translocating P-type ATPase, PMCA-type [Candidatus Aenigmarchaeota archaeon]
MGKGIKMHRGLTEEEAKRRLKKYGKNVIERKERVGALKIFISQFTSPLILLLVAAAILSLFVNYLQHESSLDSILILLIVFAAGVAGFIQDYKAEKAIEALQKMATPKARVIRNGKEIEIDSSEIVPGDLVVLEGGDVVPADAEIIEGYLEVDESPLTGESRSVKKGVGKKIFSGCGIYSGSAVAKVFATGMKTKIGEIAAKMQELKEGKTPFQKHMESFTRKIVGVSAAIVVITFAVSFGKFGLVESLLIAVSLAVAAVPEDLPAVITIALSLGARDMAKKNALVRRLAITESVGCVDVICTDKTGTITEGKMKVRNFWFLENTKEARKLADYCCFFCNNAKQIFKNGKKVWTGDETEIALKKFSMKLVKEGGEKIEEIPFTSERKMMTVAYKLKKKIIFSKGAPEVLLEKCSSYVGGGKLTRAVKQKILEKNKEFASKGYRILALAYKEYEKPLEKNLVFIGLVILSDPPRPEVKEAVKECRKAGIRVIMITGDNPMTARAVANEVGIQSAGIVTGDELDRMSAKELKNALEKGVNIFARTSPFHKLKILEILGKEHVVAMTGDGVNDSLALKKADVGIAMGIKGSEVAKEASDIILLDDNFASIRNAVKGGRRIFDNIRKFVNYLLTCNLAEVLVVLFATLYFPFIVLYPIQILWINLVTDGLPALALAVDPARPDIMRRKPRKREEGIIDKKLATIIGAIGAEKAAIILMTFFATLPLGVERARSVLFTSFIIYELMRIGVIR